MGENMNVLTKESDMDLIFLWPAVGSISYLADMILENLKVRDFLPLTLTLPID